MFAGKPMVVPDVKRLAAEISAQHGIRVDPDDPMMAVVTLNQLMLQQAVGEIVEQLQTATHDLVDAAEKVQLRAGTRLAQEVRDCAAAVRAEFPANSRKDADRRPRSGFTASRRWLVIECIAALTFLVAGFWIGTTLGNCRNVAAEAGGPTVGVESHQ